MHLCVHRHVAPRVHVADREDRRDPTGTGRIRARWTTEVRRRFAKLRRQVRTLVASKDVLALGGAPAATTDADSASANFRGWLRGAIRKEILGWQGGRPPSPQSAWTTPHVVASYKKGAADAKKRLPARARDAAVTDLLLSATLGTRAHEGRVRAIASRTYSELRDVTEEMERQMAVELGRAIGEGLSPADAADRLVDRIDKIGQTRADLVARTEIISAHAAAALESYREAGAVGVEVQAEWATAGDEAVCPECEAMEGRVFSLEEADGMIPLHPNCRCAFLPVLDETREAEAAVPAPEPEGSEELEPDPLAELAEIRRDGLF